MPLPLLPEIIQVRTVLLPPVEVMRIPSSPFGEAKGWNAATPAKVLKETKPLAWSRTRIPLSVLPEMTFPSGMTPPTCVFWEVPATRRPFPWLGTEVALSAPMPRKLAWTVTLFASGDAHTVARVAGDHIVKNKGVLKESAPDERVVVRVSDGDAILSIAQGAVAGASVPMKLPLSRLPVEAPLINTPLARLPDIRLPCGGRLENSSGGIFTACRIIDPGRLTANEIP